MFHRPHKSSCEWVAARREFEFTQETLRELDPTIRRRSLADFVRPHDHFLPLDILGRSVDDASQMSFEELRRLPGVGPIKVQNLLSLLRRIVDSAPEANCEVAAPCVEAWTDFPTEHAPSPSAEAAPDVTEHQWSTWRARLDRHALADERLGRVVRRLSDLPRTLWHARLAEFTQFSLAKLRAQKGFGPRRVAVVVEAVRRLNDGAMAVENSRGAGMIIGPESLVGVDSWLVDAVLGRVPLCATAFCDRVAVPLLDLLRTDLGEAACGIAAERLPLPPLRTSPLDVGDPAPWSERLSTSRLHQIRQDSAAALRVRWPRGEDLSAALVARLAPSVDDLDEQLIADSLIEFFPHLAAKRRRSVRRSGDDAARVTLPLNLDARPPAPAEPDAGIA